MPEQRTIAVRETDPDPLNPRKCFPEEQLLELGANIKALGQLVPVIAFRPAAAKRYTLIDGEKRWLACQLQGIETLDAVIWERRPTPSEVAITQWSIDAHRSNLTPMERSDLFARIKQESNLSVSDMAERLNIKQPLASKMLSFQNGCKELRDALDAGAIDQDKAYTICQEPSHEKQRELLKHASDLTREQLRQKARGGAQPVELKASIARFPLPTGVLITVQGRKMSLAGAINAMLEAVKELKKGQSEHWDITTAMRVMRDRAKTTE
jgi:ParB/RepB/Spo0J family partition protein